jgi:acyl-CoA synthetase (NDP forming)
MNRLDHMLKARSVAIVGASGRPGSVGEQTLRQIHRGGFEGAVHAVNPAYDTLMGLPCLPDIGDVAEAVDLAVLAVGNAQLENEAAKALAAGARSLAIFASCHATASDGSPLRDRLAGMANEADVPICGGNGMGFVNVEDGLRVCGFYQPEDLEPGGISFLTHSGSLFSAMLHNRRGLRFNLVVSTGLELNTDMSDYLDWVLDSGSTKAVALFMETVRDPEGFVSALTRAREADIPVVALKVGASSRGQAAVATHSEAIAGDDAVYEALFDTFGVHRALTMDELVDTIELMAAGRRARPGGLGAVHDSGGERAMLIDIADRVGVPLPDIAEATVDTLTQILDPGLEPANPVDAWGTGRDAQEVFVACLDALASDPAIGVVAFSVDLTREERLEDAYSVAVLAAAAHTDKPVAVLANMSTTVDPVQAEVVRDGGVPVLEGTETGLRAIKHLIDRGERLSWPSLRPRLITPMTVDVAESGSAALLHRYGIRVARAVDVVSVDEALAAATEIGFPVVLKTLGTDHKTEVGGVLLGLADADAVAGAYHDLNHRLGPRVTVCEQVQPGVEIGVGMVTDAQFGPVVVVSAGGRLIELLRDRVAVLPPIDTYRARKAIERLSLRTLLHGHRGSPAADIEGLAELVARFSELVSDHARIISSIELNPVIVGPQSVVAVDVLMKTT